MKATAKLLAGEKVLVDELCMEVYNVSAAGVFEIFSNISMMDFQDEVHHKCQMSIELDDQDKFCWIAARPGRSKANGFDDRPRSVALDSSKPK